MLALALPTATGAFMLTLPIVSVTAIVIAIVSRKWENGGIRGTAYLLHIYSGVAVALLLQGSGPVATARHQHAAGRNSSRHFDLPVPVVPSLAAAGLFETVWTV